MRGNTVGGGTSFGLGEGVYGTVTHNDIENVSSNYQRSRDGHTPMVASSSCISGNYASLVKKPQL